MCFCCCDTRKGILIYSIVISTFAFIYGIIVIAEFGSKTDVYEALIKKIEYLEAKGDTNTNSDDFWRYYFGYYSKRKLPFYNYLLAIIVMMRLMNMPKMYLILNQWIKFHL